MIRKVIKLALILPICLSSCKDPTVDAVYSSPTGIYSCQENSAYSGYRKYLVELDSVQTGSAQFIISNFHNQGDSEFLYATVIGDSIFITRQAISNLTVNGKGRIASDFKTINIQYETSDGLLDLDYYAVYSR